ncbi:polyamine aminopropyltransferase [Streptomyces sp. NPDC050617]|uniref:polyamine aminopropyltransferase n=1 Tax=Streptomyces sp. NPDC050617 TaxID=3154628 RepID=UPI0034314C97
MNYPMSPGRSSVPPGLGRFAVLTTAFICAACGLVYELELVALSSYLLGDSVTLASVVLSVMVFAMGVGSLLAKRLRPRAAVSFGALEAALAVTGGGSAIALYACYAWLGQARLALVGCCLAIGVLIGAEVPLLMTLIQRVRSQDPGGAVADLFAADYVGALVGGLVFPFLLLPMLGQLSGALLTGGINAVAGGALVLWVFHHDLSARQRRLLIGVNVLALAVLAAGAALTAPFERAARQALYGPEVRIALRTGVQEVVVTGGAGRRGTPPSLYLDGRLGFDGRDEARYHEALVHPAMAGPHRRVLVLGGGDGLALREAERYPGVRSITVVELDPGLLRLARTDPGLARLNRDAYRDGRVRDVAADAFEWLRRREVAAVRRGREAGGHVGHGGGGVVDGADGGGDGRFDVVLADLPDPAVTAGTKLYSREFYGLVRRVLAPGGRLAVHAGTLGGGRRHTFWTADATVRAAGLDTTAYAVEGRGFLLAARTPVPLRLPAVRPPLRSLTPQSLRVAGRAAERERYGRGAAQPLPSTLLRPRYAS